MTTTGRQPLRITCNQETLRTPSAPVTGDGLNDAARLCSQLTALMNSRRAVGLAAPQVGRHIRAFVTAIPGLGTVINPTIIKRFGGKTTSEEGCLSVEGTYEIRRDRAILVAYLDANLKARKTTLVGLASMVFQHECDHLDGKLISDTGERTLHV